MVSIRQADERGRTNWQWLDSRHSFSFGEYFDPSHMGHRTLRVINDDRVAQAGSAPHLVDQVNLLFCGGSMTATTRDNILNAVTQVPAYDTLLRTRLAVYLAATCPEGAVQR